MMIKLKLLVLEKLNERLTVFILKC